MSPSSPFAIWLRMIAFVAVVLSVWVSSYQGRVDVIDTQRLGCERSKLDRQANALGWRAAEEARRTAAQHSTGEARIANAKAAEQYKAIADQLSARSRIDCRKQYPDAHFVQFR